MTLTTAEIARVVIKRLKISDTIKHEWLLRRAIKPARGDYTKREFRAVRRQFVPVINTCVAKMNTFIDNGGITQAEDNYYSRTGEAPVDIVFNIVSEHMIGHNITNNVPLIPPEMRRSCTGYFGPRCTLEEVTFKEWEA